jgi:hypothetical protein
MIKIFYSYSRKDQALREKLDQHLAPLKYAGLIVPWYDLLLEPGSDWKKDIGNQLDTADMILLLVSANFLSSEYCYSIELKQALERDSRQEACVIPVILEPCDWKHSWIPFSKLTALPNHETAITEWENREAAFASVAQNIRGKVTSLIQQRQTKEQERQRQEAEKQRQVEEAERLQQAEQLRQQQEAEAARLKQQEQFKQEAEKQRQQEQANQQKPLSDALRGDYAQLEALLKAGKWQEADQETANQICQVMGRSEEGWLRVEDIEQFPCADLRAIDQLWVRYSNGKFGFSVQKKIWQQCGKLFYF